jgi:DNA-binding MarR family transcriptional regulator
MASQHKHYSELENYMLAVKKFFVEYFRQTMNGSRMREEADFTFLDLKGLSAFADDRKEYTMGELSSSVNLPSPHMTSIIERLLKKGIVKKHRDREDRRYVKVRLTDKGRELRDRFMRVRIQEIENSLGKLNKRDQGKLLEALKTATDIFRKIQYR